jgi:hypothetical protein
MGVASVGSGLGSFRLFGAVAGLFSLAAGLVAFLGALAVLVARSILAAFLVVAAGFLGGGGGGVRRGGFLGVAIDAECECESCYSEYLLHMVYFFMVGLFNEDSALTVVLRQHRVADFKICSKKDGWNMFFTGCFCIHLCPRRT